MESVHPKDFFAYPDLALDVHVLKGLRLEINLADWLLAHRTWRRSMAKHTLYAAQAPEKEQKK